MVDDPIVAARRVASVNPATGKVLRELECASDVGSAGGGVAGRGGAQAGLGGVECARGGAGFCARFQRLLHERTTEVARLGLRGRQGSHMPRRCSLKWW